MKTRLKHQYIIILCIGIFSFCSLNAQVRVYYQEDSICVGNCDHKPICFKSNYSHYGEFLNKGPVYLINESTNKLFIYNPRIELILFDINEFQADKRILFHGLHKDYNVELEFIEDRVFFKSSSRLLLYSEDLCLIGDYRDSLENGKPSIDELLVKDIEYHTTDKDIIFDITSYAKRTPKLDPDSLVQFEYSFRYK